MQNDIAYNNADFIPNAEDFIQSWEVDARTFRETEAAIGRARLNVSYGDDEREKLDIFHPSGPAEGLVIFVHGGYWLRFDRSFWSHFAAGCTSRGYAVAMPSYPLAPDARIAGITRSIAQAVEVAASLVRGPIVLTGHSAGGHLVARMACRDIAIAQPIRDRIARIVPISPVADLRPLLETTMNQTLHLDEAEAEAESPVLHAKPEVGVSVWVGAEERPAFLDQARWLNEAWGSDSHIAPGRHHFDILDLLLESDGPLVNDLLTC
ncbi:MAG: alpha/beta hydrolase [Boseongicola sp.]|nr:alpha/beta hydrolase [Boseongicola sp.]